MLTIIKNPDPILAERMPEFDFENPLTDPVQLEKDMIETMLAKNVDIHCMLKLAILQRSIPSH